MYKITTSKLVHYGRMNEVFFMIRLILYLNMQKYTERKISENRENV